MPSDTTWTTIIVNAFLSWGIGSMSCSCRHCVPAHLVFDEIANTMKLTSRATSSHLSSPRWQSPLGQWLKWKYHNKKGFIETVIIENVAMQKNNSHWYQTWEIYVICLMAHLIANTFIRLSWKDIPTSLVVGKKWPTTFISFGQTSKKYFITSHCWETKHIDCYLHRGTSIELS
jgi:hypothetical protein